MSVSINLISIIDQLIAIINSAYLALVSLFWYYCVKYGLSPTYAFYIIIDPPSRFLDLYYFILNSTYSTVLELALVAGTVFLIAKNSLGIGSGVLNLLVRFSISFLLAAFSYDIAKIILELTSFVYSYLWNYGHIDWYNIFSSLNSINWAGIQGIGNSQHGTILEFLFLSGYFISTLALLGTLMIREALLFFLILILPIFSVLVIFGSTQELAINMWRFFIEGSVLPIFIMIALIAANIFSGYYLLQLAFLSIASSMPILINGGLKIFNSTSLSTTLAPNYVGRAAKAGVAFGSKIGGAKWQSAADIRNPTNFLFGGSKKGSNGPVKLFANGKTNLDWNKMTESEVNYRKKWLNDRE